MPKRIDRDVAVLRDAVKALERSRSKRVLRANIEFIVDYFLAHPSRSLPARLTRDDASRRANA
jgi:hypothetical protein